MRAMIIDDEKHAITRLERLLKQIPEITEVVSFDDPLAGLDVLSQQSFHLIFLDIEMPVNGLEVFGRIMDMVEYIPIIFTTAYNQYAIKAFELNAMDYLLKPFRLERLEKSVDRVVKHYELQKDRWKEETEEKKLRISCFKRLSMYHGSDMINLNWRTKKAEELIAYLICEEGDFISKDKVITSLWPELDSKKGMNNLYTTLYYIRRQAQKTNVAIPIESLRGKMRFNLDGIEVDLIDMKEAYQQFLDGDKVELEEIRSLYRGMLLEEHDYPWAMILQNLYDKMYQEMVEEY